MDAHVIELSIVVSTIALTIVTALLTWVSWKLYKVDADKTNHSIDALENVAITAITHEDRVRQLKAIKSHSHKVH